MLGGFGAVRLAAVASDSVIVPLGGAVVATAARNAAISVEAALIVNRNAALGALALAADRVAQSATNLADRGFVAAELAFSRSPILRGAKDGFLTGAFGVPLPQAFTRGERLAQTLGLFAGAVGDGLRDLVD